MKSILKELLLKLALTLIEKLLDYVPEKVIKANASIRTKQAIFLKNVAKLIEYASTLPGYEITGGELWRHEIMQAYYLQKGLSKAKYSKHQDRCAIDLNVFVNGEWRQDPAAYEPLAKFWRSLDPANISGYDWKWDYNHFQMT